MNPIARLEELRAARKRIMTVPPADYPDCLTGDRAASPAENRDNRENRATDNPNKGRESGQSGESGGGTPESDLADRQRWGLPPAVEITPLTFFTPGLHRRDVDLLTAHLKRQPPDVWQWVERQAERYTAAARHWPRPVCEVAAMLDALLWQWEHVLTRNAGRLDQITEAARMLRSSEQADRYFTEHRPAPAGEKTKGAA